MSKKWFKSGEDNTRPPQEGNCPICRYLSEGSSLGILHRGQVDDYGHTFQLR